MKKFLKMLACGAMTVCSCMAFAGCNETTPPADPDTEQQTPSGETGGTDSGTQTPSGSTSDTTNTETQTPTQAELDAQRFGVLKTAIQKTTDRNTYKNGFTLIQRTDTTMATAVDEESFNPTGKIPDTDEDWTDESKELFLTTMKAMVNQSYTQTSKYVASMDGANKVGYDSNYTITKDIEGNETETLKSFNKIVKGTDNNYSEYCYNLRDEQKDKYSVGDDYYSKFIEVFEEDIVDTLLTFNQESIEDLATVMLTRMELPEDTEYTFSYQFTETDGVYNAKIIVSLEDADLFEMGEEYTNVVTVMTAEFVYDANGVQKITSDIRITGDIVTSLADIPSGDEEEPSVLSAVATAEADGADAGDGAGAEGGTGTAGGADSVVGDTITTKMTMVMGSEYSISLSYNNDLLPAFNDTDIKEADFEDQGGVEIEITYYVNGHEIDAYDYGYHDATAEAFISYMDGKYGEDVNLLNLGDDIVTTKDAPLKWYTDPECTIEYTATTYPSLNLTLYTNVTLAKGRVFYKYATTNDESSISTINERAYSRVRILDTTDTDAMEAFDLDNLAHYDAIYLNGNKVTDSFEFDADIVNVVVYIDTEELGIDFGYEDPDDNSDYDGDYGEDGDPSYETPEEENPGDETPEGENPEEDATE